MYEDEIENIRNTIYRLTNFQEALDYLYRKRDSLFEIQSDLLKSIEDYNDQSSGIKSNLEYNGRQILLQNAMRAIENTEFDLPEFKQRLFTAIQDPRTVEVDLIRNQLRVRINLDLTAGPVSDYANAVTKARRQLGVGEFRPKTLSSAMASEMWKNKYYRPAREGTEIPQPKKKERTSSRKVRSDKKERREYDVKKYTDKYYETINLRINNFTTLAPFWRIINFGTYGVPLDSDWGGTPYPTIPPTRFVEQTIQEIEKSFDPASVGSGYDLVELKTQLRNVNDALDYIEQEMYEIRSALEDLERQRQERWLNNKAYDYTRDLVVDRLQSKFSDADAKKLSDLIERLSSGEQVPERIRLGGGVRIRTVQLQRAINAYRSRYQ